MSSSFPAPTPRRDPTLTTIFGDVPTRTNNGPTKSALLNPPVAVPDPYGWMRDEPRTNPEVLNHIKEENEHTKKVTGHLEGLRTTLYEEMLSFVQETDYTSPKKRGEYLYYSRTFEGKSYKVHYRAPLSSLSPTTPITWDGSPSTPILTGETLLLDENALALNQEYCSVGSISISPNQTLLAYTLDVTGGETYDLKVLDIETGGVVDALDGVEVDGEVVWGKDEKSVFYLKMDEAHRPFQVFKHVVGESSDNDVKLFEEPDELFWLSISKSQDSQYLFITSGSKETSETNYIDLSLSSTTQLETETPEIKCVAKRRKKVLYEVEHRSGRFYISTNVGGMQNFKLMSSPALPECEGQWEDVTVDGGVVFDGCVERCLDGVCPLSNSLVCTGREGGIPRIWVINYPTPTSHVPTKLNRLKFPEEAYDVGGTGNLEYHTDSYYVTYDSLITPASTIKINLNDVADRQVIKERAVPGYDKELYACERKMVLSRDGHTHIPISLVYRKDLRKLDGSTQHLHLYGYGSYGACMESYFSSSRLPLLDRGIVYCTAHVRGGGEMGRTWYEAPNGAKFGCKKNTFDDFVDCAKYLIDTGVTEPELLSTEGRSAGGLLIGASLNQSPSLFKCAILGVPFVDVLSTMSDHTIPLTVVEWEEWGNPNEIEFFEYMKSYCPMNNVQPGGKYPACLLTGGLHDPRVQYWEPTKLAAEIRHQGGEGSGPVCLKLEMAAGHFSASDRYKYYRELAFDWAFVLDQVGLGGVEKK